ncbi:hypothetical protein [Streptomyces sp. NPDC014623]|uniref:hypothetical protein n=1 Tax=Streptomyces sp. NPDC014623 TaxID=3364875 RepID=UPI0036FF80DB
MTPNTTDATPQQHAAAMALQWATLAEEHTHQAYAAQDKITERQGTTGSFSTRLLRDHQADHAHHVARVGEAVRMAEMWARVASATPHTPRPE